MTVAVALLAPVLGTVPTVLVAFVWGAAFTAIPACLQAGVLRVAPEARDAASAVYVVAFQVESPPATEDRAEVAASGVRRPETATRHQS